MEFQYRLNGLGWADGLIEINSQKCTFSASYVTDAFGDLLESILSLVTREEHTVTILWDEEPAGVEWILARQMDDTLSVTIKRYDDASEMYEGPNEIPVHTRYPFRDFIVQIMNAADELLLTHGIVGYRKKWYQYDFPLSSYLQLKQFLFEERITKDDCERSNLHEELKLLMEVFPK